VTSAWAEIATILGVLALAIASPGPNFLLVLNRTIGDSRKSGLFTALGVATGSGIFAFVGFMGLILILSTLPHFHIVIRILGGSYLAWLGFGMLYRLFTSRGEQSIDPQVEPMHISPLHAYRSGLITNLTNPKAWAFYLSLFALVVSPTIPLLSKMMLILAMFLISFFWYATIAILLSHNRIRPFFLRWQFLIQGGIGLLLIWLGGSFLLLR